MLSKGLVRVITSYDDWSTEFNDQPGVDARDESQAAQPRFFPFPRFLWPRGLGSVYLLRGSEYMLKDGEEVEPNIYYKDAIGLAAE